MNIRTRQSVLALGAILLSTSPVIHAQQPRTPQEPGAQRSQNPDGGGRGRFQGGPGGGWMRGGPPAEFILDRIADDLGLDETQREHVEKIKAEHRARTEKLRTTGEAIREARERGDDQAADELQATFREEMDRLGGPENIMNHAVDSLDTVLTETQRTQLGEMRAEFQRMRDQGPGERMDRRLLELADELDLDEEQRAKLEDVRAAQRVRMDEFRAHFDSVRQAEEAGDFELAEQLRDEARARMEAAGGPREWFDQISKTLELTEEQLAKAAELRQQQWNRGGGGRVRATDSVPAVTPDGGDSPDQAASQATAADGGDAAELNNLPGLLKLSDDQQEEFTDLTTAYEKHAREQASRLAILEAEKAKAAADGEDEQVAQLQQQILAVDTTAADAQDRYFERLGKSLDAQQREALDDFVADRRVGAEAKELPSDLRTVIVAAMKLKLDREQKAEVRQIATDAKAQWQKIRKQERSSRSGGGRSANSNRDDEESANPDADDQDGKDGEGDAEARSADGDDDANADRRPRREDSRRGQPSKAESELAAKTKARIVELLDEKQEERYEAEIKKLGSRKTRT